MTQALEQPGHSPDQEDRENGRLHARLLALSDRDPRRAARLAHRWFGAASALADDGSARYLLGLVLLRWERIHDARAQLAAAHELFAAQGAAAMRLRCRYTLLIARQLSGEGAALQTAWQELIAAFEHAGLARDAARARCEQIAHLNVLGRPAEARSLAEASAPLLERHGSPADRARFDHVAGVAQAGCGDLDAAYAQIERARSQFAALGRPADVARVLFERAWIWQRRDRFDQARADLMQALATFRRFDLPLRVAFCEKDLGIAAAGLGDYPAAIAHALRARARFAEIGRQYLVARCNLNLGAVSHYSGLFDLAIAAYQRAERAYAELGDQRLFLICRRNQAMALCAQGRPADALAMLDAIRQPAQAMGDQLEGAELLLERAAALRQLGQPDAALGCLDLAHADFLRLGNPVAAAKCVLERGWLQLDLGRLDAAQAAFHAALAPLASRPVHYWRVLHGLGRVAEQQGEPELALAHYDAAGAVVAELRRALASEHASSGIFAQAQALYQDGLRLAARQRDTERLLGLVERQRALAFQRQLADSNEQPPPELQAHRDQLRDRLRALIAAGASDAEIDATLQQYVDALLQARHYGSQAADPPSAAFDLALLRHSLVAQYARDWTLLVPIAVEGDLLLVTITADQLHLDRTPYDATLRELIERACLPRYRLATYRDLAFARGRAATPWAGLRALADRLLPEHLRARLHAEHHLLVVPCGLLHALPWAALRIGEAWLCQLANVQQLPTLSQPAIDDRELSRSESRALLIGCQSFGGRAPELPGALASLDLVQSHWPGTVTRLESAHASRQALLDLAARDELRHYQLIHIASHAQLGIGRGLLGHIKLADDDLLVDEVLRLHLQGALVVLAACEGAASEVLPGDEVLSINRALLLAGAAGVIASLWPIYDLAVPRILDLFYRELARGAGAATALARAQRALLAEADTPDAAILGSPYIWASFCVMSVGTGRVP
jgi:tetratricopeptide (TPR) repeat protein